MLPTPSTAHAPYTTIYEPAEDSFLFLDTLHSQSAFLTSRFPHIPVVVEVGTGSGVILAFLVANAQTILGRADVVGLGVDVNPVACHVARETVEQAQRASADGHAHGARSPDQGARSPDQGASNPPDPVAPVAPDPVAPVTPDPVAPVTPDPASFLPPVTPDFIQSDLTTPLRPSSVDILLCNPPYVPSEPIPSYHPSTYPSTSTPNSLSTPPTPGQCLAWSYAGGVDGMETTSRLLAQLPRVLSPRGVAYVLLCAQNRPDRVKEGIRRWKGWEVETVGTSGKKAGWEKLQILRISRECEGKRGGC